MNNVFSRSVKRNKPSCVSVRAFIAVGGDEKMVLEGNERYSAHASCRWRIVEGATPKSSGNSSEGSIDFKAIFTMAR